MARTHHGFSQISAHPTVNRGSNHRANSETAYRSGFGTDRPVYAAKETRSRLRQRLAFAVGPTILLAMGITVVASAQSSSPFANKKKVNAWELPQAGQTSQTQTTQTNGAPVLRGLRTTSPSPVPRQAPIPAPVATTSATASTSTRSASVAPTASNSSTRTTARTQVTNQTQTKTQATAQSKTQTQVQTTQQASAIPSPTYTYGGQTSTQATVSNPATYQGSTRNWTLGSTGSAVQSSAAGQSSAYGQTQRRSVNAAPSYQNSQSQSHSINNPDADYRVHELPGRPGAAQAQRSGYGAGLAGGQTYAGNGAAGGSYGNSGQGRPVPNQRGQNQSAQAGSGWGQYESQSGRSQNPTAYDYGYGQAGPNSQPRNSQGGYAEGPYAQGPNSPGGYQQGGYQQDGYQQGGYDQGPYDQGTYANAPRRGFFDRIGLGALSTLIRGGIRAGVAARENNGWKEAFIGDADLEVEVSAITQGGLEWGIHTQARAQYDEGRKGFTRRLLDCPPTTAGCPSIVVVATPTGLRGHTSQFYSSGPDVAQDSQVALESAHLFLRSAYGDVTVGRDDGAAYLFSLGAPTLMNVGASNSPVDYTGLDAVKTINDASGFSEKITYTTPRLLGDQVGLGVQLGVSYSLNSSACGVDYCVDLNDIQDVAAPDIQDVMEAGLALDRNLASGVSVEGTVTYARGKEKSGLTGMDDLQSFGAGLEFRMNQWTLGGSWLKSNQGLMNGDYQAYDVGMTWKPSRLGFSLGYGHATDDLVGLTSDQILGGVSFDVRENFRLGLGAQYADRETLRDVAGTAQLGSEKATALFLEAGVTF